MNAPTLSFGPSHRTCEPGYDRAVLFAIMILVPLGSMVGWILGSVLALISP
jgi:hypothetical protein